MKWAGQGLSPGPSQDYITEGGGGVGKYHTLVVLARRTRAPCVSRASDIPGIGDQSCRRYQKRHGARAAMDNRSVVVWSALFPHSDH